jgi:FKBP-type peptidyl-prolyl cis-trans isomerase FklB
LFFGRYSDILAFIKNKESQMKKFYVLTLILLIAGLGACQKAGNDAAAKTMKTEDLNTQKKKASYAIGLDIGQNFKSRAMDIDMDILVQGLRDAQKTDKPLLGTEEIQKVMTQFQQDMMKVEQEKKMGQAQGNKTREEAFLKENAKKTGMQTTARGLQYMVISTGTGPLPKITDTVKVHYRGTMLDGTEFDSSYKRNEPAVFPLNGVIKGWTEALQLMKVGSKWQIFLPSSLAYGEQGAGQVIGPNATLIFDVELLGIEKAAAAAPK